ncbi:MAG: hypothetical protein ACI4LA_00910 [Emergencia sp.]
MTALIQRELTEIAVMFCCGLSVMLVFYARDEVIRRCRNCRRTAAAVYFGGWLCAAYLFCRFLYRASWGVITPQGIGALCAGILLWKKVICVIIPVHRTDDTGDKDYEEEEKRESTRV